MDKYGELNNWDVSNVTNMYGMFAYAHFFNQPLNKWNVSKVTDMAYMFEKATSFNQPLNKWNVSKVKDKRDSKLDTIDEDEEKSGHK